FFQAEDGIRDRNVTGVQTCALPICYRFLGWTSEDVELPSVSDDESTIFTMPDHSVRFVGKFERISYKVTYQFQGSVIPPNAELRSEERRVGKECRVEWWRDQVDKMK